MEQPSTLPFRSGHGSSHTTTLQWLETISYERLIHYSIMAGPPSSSPPLLNRHSQAYDHVGADGGPVLIATRSAGAFAGSGLYQRYRATNVANHIYAALIMCLLPVMVAIEYDPHSLFLAWAIPASFKGAKTVEGLLPHWLCSMEAFLSWWLGVSEGIANAELKTAMAKLMGQVKTPHRVSSL